MIKNHNLISCMDLLDAWLLENTRVGKWKNLAHTKLKIITSFKHKNTVSWTNQNPQKSEITRNWSTLPEELQATIEKPELDIPLNTKSFNQCYPEVPQVCIQNTHTPISHYTHITYCIPLKYYISRCDSCPNATSKPQASCTNHILIIEAFDL